MARNQRDINSNLSAAGTAGWSTTNITVDRTINADGLVAEIGDGLANLIEDLIAAGILTAI